VITATRYRATAEINRQANLGSEIARMQTDISTGVRIQTASDDPIAAARVAQIRLSQADQTVWQRNIDTAKSVASQVDTTLSNVEDIFNRVKELALAGSSQSVSATDRQAMVDELNGLRTTLNNLMTATTPTGQSLFPTDGALEISVSGTLRLPATDTRANVFDNVALTAGNGSLDSVIAATATAIAITDPTARATEANKSLNDIDIASTHVTDTRSAQGVRAARLDSAADALVDTGALLAEERSSLEDTDVASTVMKLNAKTLALQAAQAAFAKVNRNTLFDLIS
jgi:flagellar hook-associated protein 3 FlgL